MVICIIALPVFALLGLFSLKYRVLAKEAIRCLGRTLVLKPCDTGLDVKIKSKFTAKLMWWPWLARGVYNYFEILSWIFIILMVASTILTGLGLYNYFVYGNCNGPDEEGFCIFDIVGSGSSEQCSEFGVHGFVNASEVSYDGATIRGNSDAVLDVHEYGCYSCGYTKESEPAVKKLVQNYPQIRLVYHDVPLEIHKYSIEAGEAAICAGEQGKYWAYHDLLFENQGRLNDSVFGLLADEIGLNVSEFNICLDSSAVEQQINASRSNAVEVGIYGTPTFIINERVLVGPQKYAKLAAIVEEELKK